MALLTCRSVIAMDSLKSGLATSARCRPSSPLVLLTIGYARSPKLPSRLSRSWKTYMRRWKMVLIHSIQFRQPIVVFVNSVMIALSYRNCLWREGKPGQLSCTIRCRITRPWPLGACSRANLGDPGAFSVDSGNNRKPVQTFNPYPE
jgi:hypothetical protein